MTPFDQLAEQIKRHEGLVLHCYDDATGTSIIPGSFVSGHPTIGYGWALDVHPMTPQAATRHLLDTLAEVQFSVIHRIPWAAGLDDVRHMALVELAYNLGLQGLLAFRKMLAALESRDWHRAAEELLASRWATQVQPARRDALVHMIATGEWL